MPIFDQMVDEHEKEGTNWTPSKIINRLGKEINNPDSVYYWAYKVLFSTNLNLVLSFLFFNWDPKNFKNSIPVYSPALTDGSLGDMMYFHSYKKPGLKVDILEGN
jgi:deoxyhypusine synthase